MPKGNGKDSFRVSLSSSSESESPEPRAAEPGPNASDLGPSSSSEELHVAVPERGRRRRSPVGESKGVEESKGSGKKGKSKTNQCRYWPEAPWGSTSGRTRCVCAGNYGTVAIAGRKQNAELVL